MKLFLYYYIKKYLIKYLLRIIILAELIQITNTEYLVMNFSTINFYQNDSFDFMSIIFNNEIYSSLYVGMPSQYLKIILNGNGQTFYITEKTYNHSFSSTYKGSKNKDVFFLDNIQSGLKSNDYIKFNIKTINDIIINETFLEFSLSNSIKNNLHQKIDGEIGLQLKAPHYIGIPNFIENLKKNKFINTYQWSLIYNNENNENNNKIWNKLLYNGSIGELLIGFNQNDFREIYHLDSKKYEIKEVIAEKDKDKINWSLYFEDIYLDDTRINSNNIIINDNDINRKYLNNKLADLLITKDYNIGTKEFQTLINEEFFNYYFEKKLCSIKNIINDYSYEKFFYYICYNSTGQFILENSFPKLIFFHHDLNYTFELTYKDLFYTDKDDITKNNFYFNIIFSNYGRNKWSIGKPFLSKYLFMFEYNKKLIQLFISKKENIIKKDNSKITFAIKIIIILILAVILGLLIFLGGTYLGKKYAIYKKGNKKRANELEEDIISVKNIN